MENIQTCPICNSNQITFLFNCQDKVSSGELFAISECKTCTIRFTSSRPTEKESGIYYQSDQYVSHTDDKGGLILMLYRKIRAINLNWKVNIINKLLPTKGKLLDYGCGLGSFLNHAHKDGWKTTGMDISQEARTIVKKRFGIEVLPNENLIKSHHDPYHIITLWHVLEHVYPIHETIEAFSKNLEANGYILLALPNHLSHDAKKYKQWWDAYDVPRHIWHFNKKSIDILMSGHGFKHVKTLPMKYDGYYVSIRSEMHLGSKFYFIKGMFTGVLSHLKALKTKEYSSQLYIYQKQHA